MRYVYKVIQFTTPFVSHEIDIHGGHLVFLQSSDADINVTVRLNSWSNDRIILQKGSRIKSRFTKLIFEADGQPSGTVTFIVTTSDELFEFEAANLVSVSGGINVQNPNEILNEGSTNIKTYGYASVSVTQRWSHTVPAGETHLLKSVSLYTASGQAVVKLNGDIVAIAVTGTEFSNQIKNLKLNAGDVLSGWTFSANDGCTAVILEN